MKREEGLGEGRIVLVIVLLGIAAGFTLLLVSVLVGSGPHL